ncbi:MAG: chromosomal replication initiator protein DnaA [Ferrimicrobium sp.]
MQDSSHVWGEISDQFRLHVGEAAWKTWFISVAPQKITSDEVVLTTPSPLARERLENRYLDVLQELFTKALGAPVVLRINVRADKVTEPIRPDYARPSGLFSTPQGLSPNRNSQNSSSFDARYTFEAFIIGSSNRFAHAAALSVAETPAQSYNPLFIHGDAGLGKTHLLHAIGNYVHENYPDRYVKYVSTETFLNEFVDAIKRNRTSEFKSRYRECDVLLMDDIQFLEHKEAIQEEFFHTFNYLYGAHKQIVLTSDRSPRAIATLEDRLRSRFAMGLITDVQPPDLETRTAILRRKSEDRGTEIPNIVLEFIAVNIRENIRELEGALTRVTAYASLNQIPITLESAERILSDFVTSRHDAVTRTPAEIISTTASFFDLTTDDLLGQSRKRPIATARQIAMYVMRELTELSFPAIGRTFGGKDHTTVMHSVERIQSSMQTSIEVFEQVDQLFKLLRTPR